jgi:16S rRNA (cytosine967-C5)-methyltransferase
VNNAVLSLASKIIASSTKAKPADGVMRDELKGAVHLNAKEKGEVCEVVFTYYRWKGWLDRKSPYESRIHRALELTARFRTNPFTLPAETLAGKAVPSWTSQEVEMRPEWLRSIQRPPKLWLRSRPGQARELSKKLLNARAAGPEGLPDAVLYGGDADLFHTPEFEAGAFEIQDIASQAVGVACAPQPGETWWDACAGEGGKMLHLADLMANRGLIWASDRAEWRLERLQRRAARSQLFNYRTVPWDGGPKPPVKTLFDGILVDAPCTGLGTWGRNPHARWTTTLKDVEELSAAQLSLLNHAWQSLKPGGRLIYAVCTLTRAETEGVADAFGKAAPEMEPIPLSNPFRPALPAAPRLCLWPQDTDGNGMFIAAWRRKPAA